MNVDKDQRIKLVFRNGTVVDGVVEEWSNAEVKLRSLDGDSILIIPHPTEDIMLVKIMLSKLETKSDPEQNKTELEKKFDQAHQTSNPYNDLDNKNLADLKVEMAKQEREIIAQKLREHRPTSSPGLTNYKLPGKAAHGHTRTNQKPRP